MITAVIERAISIRQPWVEQILRRVKSREFRDFPTNIRERVYLYASLRPESTFSEMVIVGNGFGFWNTMPILSRVSVTRSCEP